MRGNDWHLVKTPGASTVRSLGVQEFGQEELLFYGEQGDFGVVKIDSLGSPRAESLLHLVPDSIEVGNVWNVHLLGSDVVFQARNHIIIYNGQDATIESSANGYHNSFLVDGRYFVREFGIGLKELRNGDLVLVDGGGLLKDEIISGITENNGSLRVWTQQRGIYTLALDESLTHLRQYGTELSEIANNFRLYSTVKLDDGRVVVATLGGGLLIVNLDGEVVSRLTRENGFPDDSQNYLYPSRFGGLWVALDNEGVVYLDNDLTRVSYSNEHGLSGYINDIDIIDSNLYVSTSAGLYKSRSDRNLFSNVDYFYSRSAETEDFELVSSQPIVWSTETYRGNIVMASEGGVFLAKNTDGALGAFKYCQEYNTSGGEMSYQAFVLYPSFDGLDLYVGLNDGLGVVKIREDDCQVERIPLGAEEIEVRTIVQSGSHLWLGTAIHGFLAIKLPENSSSDPQISRSYDHLPGRNDVVR